MSAPPPGTKTTEQPKPLRLLLLILTYNLTSSSKATAGPHPGGRRILYAESACRDESVVLKRNPRHSRGVPFSYKNAAACPRGRRRATVQKTTVPRGPERAPFKPQTRRLYTRLFKSAGPGNNHHVYGHIVIHAIGLGLEFGDLINNIHAFRHFAKHAIPPS